MMSALLRRLVVALSVFAFVSGMTVQAVPSPRALGMSAVAGDSKAGPECPRMTMEHHSKGVPVPLTCKGIMLDCVCLGTPALPDRFAAVSVVPIAYSVVAYWAPSSALLGRNVEPDLFPPIAG
jgi:hypothetical protein